MVSQELWYVKRLSKSQPGEPGERKERTCKAAGTGGKRHMVFRRYNVVCSGKGLC